VPDREGSGIAYTEVRVRAATLYRADLDDATVGGVIDHGDRHFSWYCANHCTDGARGDTPSLEAAKAALEAHLQLD
jgi:hypothetical protein